MSVLRIKDGRRYRPATRDEVLEAAAAYLVEEHRGEAITGAHLAVPLIRTLVGGRDNESVCFLFLNQRHRLIAGEVLFHGTVNASVVYPRVVVKRALELNAAAAIMGHNHPSGDPTPSPDDRKVTRKVRAALELIECRLIDHVVVTNTRYESIRQAFPVDFRD